MKVVKELFILIGQGFLYLIGLVITLGSSRMFAKWFVRDVLVNNPYLIPFVVPIIFGFLILLASKRLRNKANQASLNLFRNLYKKVQLKPYCFLKINLVG